MNLGPLELVIIALVVVLIFGPALVRRFGSVVREARRLPERIGEED